MRPSFRLAARSSAAMQLAGFVRGSKEIPGVEPVAIAQLDWRHSQLASYAGYGDDRRDLDALALLVELQRQTWGMAAEDLAPVNLLAVIPDTGGAILVAYDRRYGFNADGWLGFVFGLGSRDGLLISHMLGVRPDVRGAAGIGWALKLAQAEAAVATGHHAMRWTFDPMRGGNARLNIYKLGAVVDEMTIDKYGILTTALYGNVPSDRFIAHWDFHSPVVRARNEAAASRSAAGLTLAEALAMPVLSMNSVDRLAGDRPTHLAYEIPGDVDALMQSDPRRSIEWRSETRTLLSKFITTNRAIRNGDALDPNSIEVQTHAGDYVIDGFASGIYASGHRRGPYVLTRKDSR
jgi:chorismate synthase